MAEAETINTYQGADVSVSQCLVTLEAFIGDVDGVDTIDDATIDASDAVTAINGLIFSMESREAEIKRLRKGLSAAKGYLLNASIDLQTGARKSTALLTIGGGLKVVEEALALPDLTVTNG